MKLLQTTFFLSFLMSTWLYAYHPHSNPPHTIDTHPATKASSAPYEAYEFQLTGYQFLEGLILAIEDANKEIKRLKSIPIDQVDFSLVESFANIGTTLDKVRRSFYHLNKVGFHFFGSSSYLSSDLSQTVNHVFHSKYEEFTTKLNADKNLFARIAAVYSMREQLNLNPIQKNLLTEIYKNFLRQGVALQDEVQKNQLQAINTQIVLLSKKFNKNVQNARREAQVYTEKLTDVKGIPKKLLEEAATNATNIGKSGYLFTLEENNYMTIMRNASNPKLREKFYTTYINMALGGKYDNSQVLRELVSSKKQKAEILGYSGDSPYIDYVLEERMLSTSNEVWNFLDSLRNYVKPHAQKDIEKLRHYKASKTGGNTSLSQADIMYWREQYRKEHYGFTEQEISEYFPQKFVTKSIFQFIETLYSIEFREAKDIPTYHSDVVAYEVYDLKTNRVLGVLYADLFSRIQTGKEPGAWVMPLRQQSMINGVRKVPLVSLQTNFKKPENSKDIVLLSMLEVETFLHELAHALHELFSMTPYRSMAGTAVKKDFVEFPALTIQRFLYQSKVLKEISNHKSAKKGTKKPLPNALIAKILKERKFMISYDILKQISHAQLDMAWHSKKALSLGQGTQAIVNFERDARKSATLESIQLIPNTALSTRFGHLVHYSVGYYSYLWADNIAADAFLFLTKNNTIHQPALNKFRKILEQGGGKDPMDLYKEFRSKEPDPAALVKSLGL